MTQSMSGDSVGKSGLVASLARPGGNVTGLATIALDLSGKRLELLKEVVPKVSRMAVLFNSSSANGRPKQARQIVLRERQRLRPERWGYSFRVSRCVAPPTSRGYSKLHQRSGPALSWCWTTLSSLDERRRIVKLAAQSWLLAIYVWREAVEDGGLMAYGANVVDIYRRAAVYVDKILKGDKAWLICRWSSRRSWSWSSI